METPSSVAQIFGDLSIKSFDCSVRPRQHKVLVEKFNFFATGNLNFFNRFNSSLAIRDSFSENLSLFRGFNQVAHKTHYKKDNSQFSNLICDYIKETKVKSAAVLFSGGKDSTLLAKLLIDNGIKVKLYHVTPFNKSDLKIDYIERINLIAQHIKAESLNISYGGLNSNDTFRAYGNNPYGLTAASGLANIFSNSEILSEESIWFSQGVDTLSNVVHTQTKYFNDHSIATKIDIFLILQRMLSLIFPKKYRLFGLYLAKEIWSKTHLELDFLVGERKSVVSIVLGIYLVHSPTDSEFVYKISNLNRIQVFNPFHSLKVQNYFIDLIKNIDNELKNQINKIIILNELEKLNIADLPFLDSGFKIRQIADGSEFVSEEIFRKQIFNLYTTLLDSK
jgi:hypothetical protein